MMRLESDFLGERPVPADALYGIQTVRALENFGVGGDRLCDRPALIAALAHVKSAAAKANRDVRALDPDIASSITSAAGELAEGRFHDHLPVEITQGGGGTSTHMNVNEVLANRANELLGHPRGRYAPVHPNDHVNRSQSTNDVIPTAMGLAVHAMSREAIDRLEHLRSQLLNQAAAQEGLHHLGRTCLQDALPVPVSAVHRAQAHVIAMAMARLDAAARQMLAVPLGATAVGTGFGAPDGFRERAIRHLRQDTGLDVHSAENPFAALASLEPFAAVADALAGSGRAIARVAADLRLLASGPGGGIGEVSLPPLQPGSSSMPGKVNPVMPEMVIQVAYQLAGAAHTVHLAAGGGELELAAWGPVVTAELLRGLDRLGRVAVLFGDRCVAGLTWQHDQIASNLEGSLEPAVAHAEAFGHKAAAAAQWQKQTA
jgi:aspartate ammonia-lyase